MTLQSNNNGYLGRKKIVKKIDNFSFILYNRDNL